MWDDTKNEIFDIINQILYAPSNGVPATCPICGERQTHLYAHKWNKSDRGTIWVWCSHCRTCGHGTFHSLGSVTFPSWWENNDMINQDLLMAHPDYLEEQKDIVDKHLNNILQMRNLGDVSNEYPSR